ncbi:MAG: valine--tRNA ligase [Dehalococcoidia bacterium]
MSQNNNSSNMSRAYSPGDTESRIYKFWEDSGYFQPNTKSDKDPFVMIMPPPNVTGELHMGHALTVAVEDMIVRWHRMKGEPTLFLPGTDHAGIATQVVVERLLATEGVTRYQLGREKFEERIWEWVETYGNRIYEQLRRLGTSCDWSRSTFTLDETPRAAVRKTFVDLYQKGLIYRGERIANWCPRCATALSELEVKYKEIDGNLYHIKYPFADGSGFLVVATTRPETMLGDTGVAVNPSDARFKEKIGKEITLPLTNRLIPVIADDAVEVEFGTGALKVTPAHDPVDFEIGSRNELPLITVIDNDGKMNFEAGKFQHTDRFECRKLIQDELEAEGLLLETEPFRHSVGHCDRCDEIIEPLISKQWYVSMESLAKPAIAAVKDNKIQIIPERFTSVYFNWMENIRDWPVSRQLWWGHQIPVWYCQECSAETVPLEDPTTCQSCGSTAIEQDQDVLDTWFSSGLWTHSTLGWPDDTEDLQSFYPGSVMETGYDILFFWVARMIMLGIANMGEIPFHTIYLHGLVLDPEGVKMSKTKGNVLNPLDLIDEYGADAVRFALTTGTSAGNNLRMNEQKLESSRNFANKLWNASRFVISNLDSGKETPDFCRPLNVTHRHDKWILSRLDQVTINVNRLMGDFQFGEAQTQIHDFLWNEYCDWYIELTKDRLRTDASDSPLPTLAYVLERTLRLLHPFLPFVTEEIWGNLCKVGKTGDEWPDSLITAQYPEIQTSVMDDNSVSEMVKLIEFIRAIRNMKSEFSIQQRQKISCRIAAETESILVKSEAHTIENFAGVAISEISDSALLEMQSGEISIVANVGTAYLELGDNLDLNAELVRLQTERDEISKYISSLNKRLSNQSFVDKAPPEVVEKEKERLQRSNDRETRISEILATFI